MNNHPFTNPLSPLNERLSHGTTIRREHNRPVAAWDRHGTAVFEATWAGAGLTELTLHLPEGRQILVRARAGEHPLFGPCDTISLVEGPPLAYCQAVDWANPAHIPPLDQPGALPAGAGTAILNFLALQGQRNNRPALRYRGPYPTGILFDALTESFRPQGDLLAAFERFTAEVETTATQARMVEVPVDFAPAPFERVWLEEGICVQLRHGLEKVYLQGRTYSRQAAGARRVRAEGGGYVAVVEIGGAPWAEVLRLDERGEIVDGPHPLPPVSKAYTKLPFPDSIRATLVEALPARAPALMQPALRQILETTPIVWGDAGDDVGVVRQAVIVLHAVLLERLANQPAERILNAIAQAIEPPAQQLAQQILIQKTK